MPLEDSVPIVSVLTFVLAGTCGAVGIVGIAVPEIRETEIPAETFPEKPEILSVDLADTDEVDAPAPPMPGSGKSEAPVSATPSVAPLEKPALDVTPPALPALCRIAVPERVVFPVAVPLPPPEEKTISATPKPEKMPEDISEPGRAVASGRADTPDGGGRPDGVAGGVAAGGIPGAPVRLVYGVGAGKQPSPEYPYGARRLNQTGSVRVRFGVSAGGRVVNAQLVEGCPFQLLNNAALRVIRSRWRFPEGLPRLYEVEIRFELK